MIKRLESNWFYIKQTERIRRDREMEEKKWETEALRLVQHYKMMQSIHTTSSMLREVRYQYNDMASGGDGGDLGFTENGETTCRGINYPNYPDWVFQKVVEEMEWSYED